METIKVGSIARVKPSFSSKIMYMKNVPRLLDWDTKDKRTIMSFITKYEIICNAMGCARDEMRVRSFGSYMKEGAYITFLTYRSSKTEAML